MMRKLKNLKRIFSLMLALVMVLGMAVSPMLAQAADAATYVKQLISYYKTYQDTAATDIERVLSELKQVDAETGEAWEKIMDYWNAVNQEGFVNVDTVPEGIPEDDSVAIVILGYALNADGTMTEELIGRLQTGLNIANVYTNAYVVVTGGGTAANNPDVTEGGLMGEWLLEQGLDEKRLIVENRAPDTVGNAKYTYEILKSEYPQVDSVVLVTSDYHVPRGCILYYSKFVLDALEAGGEPLTIVSNAGYGTGREGYESMNLQASGVCSVAGISSSGLPSVTLSVLDSLTVSQESAYVAGEELNLTVTANYDSGYSKDVSDVADISGFEPALGADQTVTVSYTENDVVVTGTFALSETEKEIVDYASKINALLAQINAASGSVYTKESAEILDIAVSHAEEVLAKDNAAESELKSAYETLVKAKNALKVRENIALNKTVTASHNNDNAYKITDGSTGTYWESVENGNIAIEDTEFVIDLNGVYAVETITAVPYFGGNERYYHYDISLSEDNTTWTKVAEQRSTDDTLESGATFELSEAVNARYIKVKGVAVAVTGRDDINNFHMTEMMAYGELVQAVEDEAELPLENLALYGEVTVDSGTKNYVITDGMIANNYWGSANGIDAAYCTIELLEEAEVEEIKVVTYYNNTSKWYTYEVLVSTDNEEWTSVGKYETEANVGSAGYTITLDEPVRARYVKVKGLTTNNTNFHLVEVQVFGAWDNIAKTKPVEASHVRSTDTKYAASNIVDGVGTTSAYWDTGDVVASVADWANTAEADLPYVIIDLEAIYALDYVNVMTYQNASRYYQYRIYTSADGENYTLFGEKNDTETSLFGKSFAASEDAQARYIKIIGTYNSANPGFHLLEVRATGSLVSVATADYSAVEAAKAKVPTDLSVYTVESVVDVKLALAAVEEGLTVNEQDKVDAMAKAIEDAVAALVLKPEEPESPFEDVLKTDFYYDAVLWAAENGITSGKSETIFAPGESITRGEMITFLWRKAGCPKPTAAESSFEDVQGYEYYYEAVLWAVENGIASGTSEARFSPNIECTRAQIVTFLWRAAGCLEATTVESPFEDVEEYAYYYDAVLWAVENGITSGKKETVFDPDGACTRGEAVTFLYRQ